MKPRSLMANPTLIAGSARQTVVNPAGRLDAHGWPVLVEIALDWVPRLHPLTMVASWRQLRADMTRRSAAEGRPAQYGPASRTPAERFGPPCDRARATDDGFVRGSHIHQPGHRPSDSGTAGVLVPDVDDAAFTDKLGRLWTAYVLRRRYAGPRRARSTAYLSERMLAQWAEPLFRALQDGPAKLRWRAA